MSAYTRLQSGNTQQSQDHGSNAHEHSEDENERLVAAFNDDSDESGSDSDSDNNEIQWADDRNISMNRHNLNEFTIDDDLEDGVRVVEDSGNRASAVGSSSSTNVDVTTDTTVAAVPLRTTNNSTNNSMNSSNGQRGLAQILFSLRPFRPSHSGRSLSLPDVNNDGVFSNLSARPETQSSSAGVSADGDKPPTYEEAAADATPPYWETTIMTPGMGDELFIDGLPLGSTVNFVWNMMVSAAFQFVGFFLTYLLHTSHASKQGSRAGLGFTLVQCGYYLQPDGSGEGDSPVAPPVEVNPDDPNDIGGESYNGHFSTFAQSTTTVVAADNGSTTTVSWMSTLLMVVGAIIILKSVGDYVEARRMENAILSANGASEAVDVADESPEEQV